MDERIGTIAGRAAGGRRNAVETVFQDLRAAIAEGRLPVGSRLPSETRLAASYGVSRPIIREAMRSLQTLGLTCSRPGSGSYVISASQQAELAYGDLPARDLIEARPLVEVPAAGWAALRRSPAQAAQIQRLCERMEAEADPAAWVRLDCDLHCAIAQASGNALLARIVAQTREALRQQSGLVNLMADRRAASNVEHRRICEAILGEGARAAREAMRAHLAAVAHALERIAARS